MAARPATRRRAGAAPVPDVTLAEMLDLREASPLAAALLACRGTDVTIDAGPVRRLGGQCLQVLLAARASWQADGKSLRIVRPSADFIQAVERFGAGDLLPGRPE